MKKMNNEKIEEINEENESFEKYMCVTGYVAGSVADCVACCVTYRRYYLRYGNLVTLRYENSNAHLKVMEVVFVW